MLSLYPWYTLYQVICSFFVRLSLFRTFTFGVLRPELVSLFMNWIGFGFLCMALSACVCVCVCVCVVWLVGFFIVLYHNIVLATFGGNIDIQSLLAGVCLSNNNAVYCH